MKFRGTEAILIVFQMRTTYAQNKNRRLYAKVMFKLVNCISNENCAQNKNWRLYAKVMFKLVQKVKLYMSIHLAEGKRGCTELSFYTMWVWAVQFVEMNLFCYNLV